MARKTDWIIAAAGLLMLALACCNPFIGQTVPQYGVPSPVFRQNQTTGDATAQQNIIIPSPFSFTVQSGATITFGAGTIGLGSLATIPNGNVLGNSSGGAASPSAQSVAAPLALTGGSLGIQTAGVPNTSLAQAPANTIKGNNTGSPAAPTDLTVSQINVLTGNYNGAVLSGLPADPTGTASGTLVMMGLGSTCTITPVISTRVLITIDGGTFNSTAGDRASFQINTGTGAAPANGVAVTGTARGKLVQASFPAANAPVPFSLTRMVTGLTPGQPIWIDVALEAVLGGTASIQNVTCTATEQ